MRCFALVALVVLVLRPGLVRAQEPQGLAPQEIVLRGDSMNERALTTLAERLLREERYEAADSAVRRALLIEPLYGPAHDVLWRLLIARDEELQESLERGRLTPEQELVLSEARASRRLSFLIDPIGADDAAPLFECGFGGGQRFDGNGRVLCAGGIRSDFGRFGHRGGI